VFRVNADKVVCKLSAVFWGWSGIATWVIMTNDDGWTIAYDSWPVDFSCTEHGAIDCTLVTTDVFYHAIFGIENRDAHLV
jgi:hypothetical protein